MAIEAGEGLNGQGVSVRRGEHGDALAAAGTTASGHSKEHDGVRLDNCRGDETTSVHTCNVIAFGSVPDMVRDARTERNADPAIGTRRRLHATLARSTHGPVRVHRVWHGRTVARRRNGIRGKGPEQAGAVINQGGAVVAGRGSWSAMYAASCNRRGTARRGPANARDHHDHQAHRCVHPAACRDFAFGCGCAFGRGAHLPRHA
ncbi:hypothetical protein SAMN05216551_1125 [Chitinasiproducens palmae]|uniref:Uncharacterized protein n=1 Tax=Chitinasiproducens palmae TaxID=1770053 RepID=A0A1H2PUK4_9BURK|nr:hypothetical protein SAMN05216551_1125 [Chitinasiproducens palmae]